MKAGKRLPQKVRDKLRRDYLFSNLTHDQLAKRHQISSQTILNWASRENWYELREMLNLDKHISVVGEQVWMRLQRYLKSPLSETSANTNERKIGMDEKKLKAVAQSQFTINDYAPAIQEEIRQLMNIERFLKRVKEINGDEAFAYVDARQYLAGRAAMLGKSEEARLAAMKAPLPPSEEIPTPPSEESK